ncbi:MAG TPA: hypothetical protein VGD40_07065 [Chryseosolibacter sp.]
MRKAKKNSGNQNADLKPVSESGKQNASAGRVSGSPDSVGGSREGNIGHEHSTETGRGDRQV